MWQPHVFRVGPSEKEFQDPPGREEIDSLRKTIEPWLTSVFQTEHLSLLLGSGLTMSVAFAAGASPVGMAMPTLGVPNEEQVDSCARESATASGRGQPNIEDKIRAAIELLGGLKILSDDSGSNAKLNKWASETRDKWREALATTLQEFVAEILATERGIRDAQAENKVRADALLMSFLLSFASRTATRERLSIFTTNYDRIIEYGCDQAGIRVIDRFIGTLTPVFRASRLDIDYHYSPPGVRGEPRYLEGVVRMGKLHGSLDWRWQDRQVRRYAIHFGADADHPDIARESVDSLLIYPNPAKDVETVDFPYAELFRDFSAAICRPNSALVTYGYGFGDDHVNRVIKDMLTIPSTHLVVVSYDDASGRIPRFCDEVSRPAQISLLIGSHFGDLSTLVEHYLPKPAIDAITWRRAKLLARRGEAPASIAATTPNSDDEL